MAGMYPDRERTLRHLRFKRGVYLYGRMPQRYAIGFGPVPESPSKVPARAVAGG